MIQFFKKKEQEKAIVALDIGTETVKAVLFTVEEKQSMTGEVIGKRGIIRGVGKVPQQMWNMQISSIMDIGSVIQNAKQAITIAAEKANMQPEKIVLGIAGEFVKGETSTQVHEREDSNQKINVSELRNIVHKLQWKAFGEARKALSEETGYPEIDVKLVSSSVVSIKIDGYRVSNPLGFQGKKVEMSIFNSFAPLGHFAALEKIASELKLELISIASEPFALSKCLDFEEGEQHSAIFIDIGGCLTDIAVVQNGTLLGTKMFGIGGRTFTKRFSVELNISFAEAEKLKHAYTADRLEQKSKKILSDIVTEDLEVWLDGLVLALSEYRDVDELPQKILLSGGGAYLPEIKSALNNRKWHKKLPFKRAPQASYLNPKNLRGIIDETNTIKEREDIIPLGLVNLGVELSGEEKIVQKVLRKVIGIMKV